MVVLTNAFLVICICIVLPSLPPCPCRVFAAGTFINHGTISGASSFTGNEDVRAFLSAHDPDTGEAA